MSITRQFLQERIDATKANIVELEDAASSIVSGQVGFYTMNTGQGVVTVTKLNIKTLYEMIDLLLSRLSGYESRMNGSNVQYGRAAW